MIRSLTLALVPEDSETAQVPSDETPVMSGSKKEPDLLLGFLWRMVARLFFFFFCISVATPTWVSRSHSPLSGNLQHLSVLWSFLLSISLSAQSL